MSRDSKINLILLDIMMNGNDEGFEVIRRLRASGNEIPIIVLERPYGGFRYLVRPRYRADDYIGKPFNPVVLGAKESTHPQGHEASRRSDFITAGPFCYNNMTMELFKDNQPIPLSSRRNVLMKLFLCNADRVFTKEQLYEHVWNGSVVDANTIMVYISHLRNKIEEDPKNPGIRKTVWGLGYKFSVK